MVVDGKDLELSLNKLLSSGYSRESFELANYDDRIQFFNSHDLFQKHLIDQLLASVSETGVMQFTALGRSLLKKYRNNY